MRCQSSGSSTCAYGLHSQAGFMFERRRSAMRQDSFARGRRATSKRKLHDDNDDDEQQQQQQNQQQQHEVRAPSVPVAHHGRIVVDEFGNRILVDGLKRMRVSSPPRNSTNTNTIQFNTTTEDCTMDDSDVLPSAIVPVGSTTMAKTPTLVGPAVASMSFAGPNVAADPAATDPSCRAMVLFDPHRALIVERSPRILLVGDDSEKSDEESSEDETGEFVRFEELPDDEPVEQEDEAEAMELD